MDLLRFRRRTGFENHMIRSGFTISLRYSCQILNRPAQLERLSDCFTVVYISQRQSSSA